MLFMPISEARRLDFSLLYRVYRVYLVLFTPHLLQIVVITFKKKNEHNKCYVTYRDCIARDRALRLFVKNLTFDVTFRETLF